MSGDATDNKNVDHEILKGHLDVHLAEYNALTMRNTYWITLQYVVYGIAGAYLGCAAEAAANNNIPLVPLMWVSGLVLQVLAWGLLQIQYEIFNNVEYLERRLKPAVKKLIGSREVWGYEPFLADQRAQPFARFEWKYSLLVLFLFVFVCIVGFIAWNVWRGHWTRWDTMWACANMYVGVIVFKRARQNAGVRRRMISPEELQVRSVKAGGRTRVLQLLSEARAWTKRIVKGIRIKGLSVSGLVVRPGISPESAQEQMGLPPAGIVVAASCGPGAGDTRDGASVAVDSSCAGLRDRQEEDRTEIDPH